MLSPLPEESGLAGASFPGFCERDSGTVALGEEVVGGRMVGGGVVGGGVVGGGM